MNSLQFIREPACDRCPLGIALTPHLYRRHLCIPTRPWADRTTGDTALVVVGKAPAGEESETGQAFVGMAGSYLDKWLAAMRFPPNVAVYLTNTVRCRLFKDDSHLTQESVRACRHFLAADLEYLKTQHRTIIFLLLGGDAVQAFGLGSIRDAVRRQGQSLPLTHTVKVRRMTRSAKALVTDHYVLKMPGVVTENKTISLGTYPVYATYHPAATLPFRSPALQHAVADHLQLLSSRLLNDAPAPAPSGASPPVPMATPFSADRTPVVAAIDIETYGIDESVGKAQTVFHPRKMVAVDGCPQHKIVRSVALWTRDGHGHESGTCFLWDNPVHRQILGERLRAIQQAGVPLVGHNILFDIQCLRFVCPAIREVLSPPLILEDTAIWNSLSNSERPERNLESLTRLFGIRAAPADDASPRAKKFKSFPTADHPDALAYNLQDARTTLALRDYLIGTVTGKAQSPETQRWYSNLLWLCLEMSENGINYSIPDLTQLLHTVEIGRHKTQRTATGLGYENLAGPGSLAVVQAIVDDAVRTAGLENDLRLERTPATGAVSTGSSNRQLLLGALPLRFVPQREAVAALHEFKRLGKLKDTYVGPLLNLGKAPKFSLIDGTAYPLWYPAPLEYSGSSHQTKTGGTKQARITCERVQTDPPELQACYCPPHPGWVNFKADAARLELMVAALLSGDPRMLHDVHPTHDMHAERAIEFFGTDALQKPNWSTLRHTGKTANFLWINRGGWLRLQESVREQVGLELSRDVCQRFIARLKTTYPRLYATQNEWIRGATRNGYVEDPVLGVRRWVTRSYSTNAGALASTVCNFYIQTIAALFICDVMIGLHTRIRTEGRAARIQLNVYDAVRWTCPRSESLDMVRSLYNALRDSWYAAALFKVCRQTVPFTFEVQQDERKHTLPSPWNPDTTYMQVNDVVEAFA